MSVSLTIVIVVLMIILSPVLICLGLAVVVLGVFGVLLASVYTACFFEWLFGKEKNGVSHGENSK